MNLNSLYIGTVLNNSDISDVENEQPRGQVKVLINGISTTSSDGDEFGFPFGKNLDKTVSPKTKELVDDYEIWAYVLTPITGGGGSLARYNASSDLAIVSDADFPTNLNDPAPAENYTGITIGDGFTGADPNLVFYVGDTISFIVNAAGHPFYLKTVAGTGTGDTISGVTNNGTESGIIVWTPTSAGTFYYQCSLHAEMVGTITIQ